MDTEDSDAKTIQDKCYKLIKSYCRIREICLIFDDFGFAIGSFIAVIASKVSLENKNKHLPYIKYSTYELPSQDR